MNLKPLEVGDSVRVKQNITFKNREAEVYIDGKLIENSENKNYWLVEYELAGVKHQWLWHTSDITSKHYARVTDEQRFEKAVKIAASDYTGMVYWDDRYFDDVTDLLEEISGRDEDDRPEFAWACYAAPVKKLELDLSSYVSNALEEDGYEGLCDRTRFIPLYERLSAIEDDFVAEAAKETVWNVNYTKAVIL